MVIKKLLWVALTGAVSTVGSLLAKKIFHKMDDPVYKAELKKKIKKLTKNFKFKREGPSKDSSFFVRKTLSYMKNKHFLGRN